MERTNLIESARAAGFPRIAVPGCGLVVDGGEAGWAERTRGLAPGHLAQLGVELERHAAEAERLTRAAAMFEPEPAPSPEDVEAEAMLIENERAKAEEDYGRFEAKRGERIEELLGRIVGLLERQAGVRR